MKINKILACAFTAFSLLAGSCDKIDEENYLTFSGAAGEWYDGNGVEDQSQRVFLEKYTGQNCVYCPEADDDIREALNTYSSLIAVSVHDSSAFCEPRFDTTIVLRTEDGNTWSRELGLLTASKPMMLLNRTLPGSSELQNDKINNILAQNAKVAVNVTSTLAENVDATKNDTIKISVDLEFLEKIEDALTLTLFIMEDGIIAYQMQSNAPSIIENYVHNHVLRDVITDVWGMDIEADGKAGTKRCCLINYDKISEDWNLANCHIVAFVSKKGTKEILNAAECSINF